MRLPSARTMAVLLNAGRVGIGAIAMSGPRGAQLLLGEPTLTPATNLLTRMAGARDIAVGAATLDGLRKGKRPRMLFAAGAFCDGTDAVAALTTPGLTTKTRALVVSAAAPATLLSLWLMVARWDCKPRRASKNS